MNEIVINQINKRIDDLINLRTLYFTGMLTVTGGIIGVCYNLNVIFNVVLLVIGIVLDIYFVLSFLSTTVQIKKLVKRMEMFK